jgi:hypothetical protein
MAFSILHGGTGEEQSYKMESEIMTAEGLGAWETSTRKIDATADDVGRRSQIWAVID